MQYRFGNLIFENFLPPFKISNMVWFRHDLLRTYSGKVAMLTIYATNSDGRNSLTVLLSISDSASTGMYASVSNRYPHFQQDQKSRTSPSVTYSDQSAAIRVFPHLSQVMDASFFIVFFCRLEGEHIGIVTVESLARRFASLCMSEKEGRFRDSGHRLLFRMGVT
jgi:hypothetical protein